jgi:hypothetical protein
MVSLTFSKPVSRVIVNGAAITLTDNSTRAVVDVGDGALDVVWSGPGGGDFQKWLVFVVDPPFVDPPFVDPPFVDPPFVDPPFDGIDGIVFLPVTPGGSIAIVGTSYDVDPFYIAQHETTNAQYDAFVQAADGFNDAAWWADMPAEYSPPRRGLGAPVNDLPDAPRETVSWYQAVAFTRWLNARMASRNSDISLGGVLVNRAEWEVRLPAEWEWQWAAQGGPQGLDYPWGDWQNGNANTFETGVGTTVAVGSYPRGAAVSGALDMTGNVWEWCLNNYSLPCSTRVASADKVVRGGSFDDSRDRAASSFRPLPAPPNGAGRIVGFRVGLFSP